MLLCPCALPHGITTTRESGDRKGPHMTPDKLGGGLPGGLELRHRSNHADGLNTHIPTTSR